MCVIDDGTEMQSTYEYLTLFDTWRKADLIKTMFL